MLLSIPTVVMPTDKVQQFADLTAMLHRETACIRAEMAANQSDPRHFLARLVQDAARQARQNTMEGPAPPMMSPEQLWTGAIRDDWTTTNPNRDWDLLGGADFPINIDSFDDSPPPCTCNQIRRNRYRERRRKEHAQDQHARHKGTRC